MYLVKSIKYFVKKKKKTNQAEQTGLFEENEFRLLNTNFVHLTELF